MNMNVDLDHHPTTIKLVRDISKAPEDAPSVVESDASSFSSGNERLPLQWQFKGLTLWLEFEEFEDDLMKANRHFSALYGTEQIPIMHCTAIYGMEHLSIGEAREKLAQIPNVLPKGKWPTMEPPVAVKQDIAQEGLPGQVCTIAWAELTLKSTTEHESALDGLCKLFGVERASLWSPHISLAYDNPDDSDFSLTEMLTYIMQHPTILGKSRKVKAISLWNTVGKLGEWKFIDRVYL